MDNSSHDPQEELDLNFDSKALYEKEEVYKNQFPCLSKRSKIYNLVENAK